MITKWIKRNGALAVALLLGAALVQPILWLGTYKDEQTTYFNAGLEAAKKQDYDGALKAFQASIDTWKARQDQTWQERFFMPGPDQELAALAYFHQANVRSQIKGAKLEDVLSGFVQSLRLNNGQVLIPGAGMRDDGLHQYAKDACTDPSDRVAQASSIAPTGGDCILMRLKMEAEDTRNNMQVLLDAHPELMKALANGSQMGKGDNGKSSKGGPKDANPADGEPGGKGHTHNNPKAI